MNTGSFKWVFVMFLVLFLFGQQQAYALTKAPTNIVSLGDQKVLYNLPDTGILPDHPFYFLKQLRDFITEITTRDSIKKAQLYLNYSDKHTSMALKLAEKGKEQLTVKTLTYGEECFIKIVPLLETSKKQGVSAPDDLVAKLKNSNVKHREVIDVLLKQLNQGEREGLIKVLNLNNKAKEQLENMK